MNKDLFISDSVMAKSLGKEEGREKQASPNCFPTTLILFFLHSFFFNLSFSIRILSLKMFARDGKESWRRVEGEREREGKIIINLVSRMIN